MPRFVVIETHGFLQPMRGRSGQAEGVSCSVLDETWDRVVATYRSEERKRRGTLGVRAARRLAREHAARLEAEYGG